MTRSIQRYFAAGTIPAAVALALWAPGAMAQDADQGQGQGQGLEEVRITGSRITLSPGMYTPTPVTAVTQEELIKMAPTNVIDSLTALPQFFGNNTFQQALGGQSPSGSQVNLRGANTSLGISRTLVLLDGRRSTPNSRFGSVDVSSFPDDLLKGVEVVTGGASATYGTDAVAGVVNFLLDTKFDGVKVSAQGGQTARHDGDNSKFALTFGHQFGEKLHVVGSLAYYDQDAISDFGSLTSRPWFNQASRVPGPAGGPTWVVANYVVPTNFSYNGTVVGVNGLNGMQFSPDGRSLLPAPTGVLGAVGNACNCLATPNETYSVNSMDEVAGGYVRKNAFLHGTFDINDKVQVFGQYMYSDDAANVRWQSAALLASWAAPVGLDNPYLAPGIKTQLQTALATQFPNATGALSAANGYGPGYRYVYAGRDLLATQYFTYGVYLQNTPGNPLGETRQITQNKTNQGTLGFKADVGSWRLDGYAQKGQTLENYIDKNGTRVDRLFFAMDAVADANGNPVCRVASPTYDPTYYKSFADCSPINLFGGRNNISPQAASYVSGPTKLATQHYDLTNAELTASGDLFQGWAGPIGAAFGAAWRKEEVLQRTPDPSNEYPAFLSGQLIGNTIPTQPTLFRGIIPQGFYINQYGYTQPWPTGAPTVPAANGQQTGGIPGLYYVPTGFLGDANSSTIMFSSERTFGGQTTVKELFSEFSVPMLKDIPGIKNLSTNLAARWADYSGSGTVWAWKAGIDWAFIDSLRMRVTRSRDVRAASLEERFDTTRGGATINNPYVLTGGSPTTQSGASFSGGNPNLAPEKADTWTAGFVFTPTFFEGFSASIDWYKIDIADAIDQPTAQQVVDAAFKGDPQYQALLKLDSGNNLVEVDRFFINFSKVFIEGVDLEASYRKSVELFGGGPEQVVLRFYATDLIKNASLTQFGTYDEWAGQVGTARSLPKHKYTANLNYSNGPYSLFMQGRYIGNGKLDHTLAESPVPVVGMQSINDNTIGSIFYLDMNVGYTVPVAGDMRIYGQVQNVMDRSPPTVAAAYGRTGSNSNNPQLYDVLGRRYFLGLNYKF